VTTYYLDIGGAISLIAKKVLLELFLDLLYFMLLRLVQLLSIGNSSTTNTYINLPIEFLIYKGNILLFIAEVYVINTLLYNVLLSGRFLKENLLYIK
jgi:hypothetical protein